MLTLGDEVGKPTFKSSFCCFLIIRTSNQPVISWCQCDIKNSLGRVWYWGLDLDGCCLNTWNLRHIHITSIMGGKQPYFRKYLSPPTRKGLISAYVWAKGDYVKSISCTLSPDSQCVTAKIDTSKECSQAHSALVSLSLATKTINNSFCV